MSRWRAIFIMWPALLLAGLIFSITRAATTGIVINEIAAYEAGDHEWLEIFNKGSEAVDLTGWIFWENKTNHKLTAVTGSGVVASGAYAIIAQDATQFLADHPGFSGVVFDSAWSSLNESGEEIGLKDAAGNFVEQFTYLTAKDFSLERVAPGLADYSAANWHEHASGNTAGQANSSPVQAEVPPSTSSTPPVTPSAPLAPAAPAIGLPPVAEVATATLWRALRLSEVVPHPAEGREWVEIFNGNTARVDLTGGTLCDSRAAAYCTVAKLTGIIEPLSWLVITLPTGRLNDDGDQVLLKNPDGAVMDAVSYGEAEGLNPTEGEGLARGAVGEWLLTSELTPGRANSIRSPVPVGTTGALAASTTSSPATKREPVKAKGAETTILFKLVMPKGGEPGTRLLFDALDSADPRGGALFVAWQFSDGRLFEGARVERSFVMPGVYTGLVLVTSTVGTTGSQKFTLTIGRGISAAGSGVSISEIFPDPAGVDSREFIELTNSATSSLNISGWKLENAAGSSFTIPSNTWIRPGSFLVFQRAVTRLNLANTGDRVGLVSDDGDMMDSVPIPKGAVGKSFGFNGFAMAWSDPTPGYYVAPVYVPAVAGVKIKAVKSKAAKSVSAAKSLVTRVIDLAAARLLPKGRAVQVEGVVTAPPGTFGSQVFYISDATGGLPVYQNKHLFPPLAIGDVVSARGIVSVAAGQKRVNIKQADDVDILDAEQPLQSQNATTLQIATLPLGTVVTVAGELTEKTGSVLYVDDGLGEVAVYLKSGAKIQIKDLLLGTRLAVTGVVEQSARGREVWPREQADVVVFEPSAVASSTAAGAPEYPAKRGWLFVVGCAAAAMAAYGLRHRSRLWRWLAGALQWVRARF